MNETEKNNLRSANPDSTVTDTDNSESNQTVLAPNSEPIPFTYSTTGQYSSPSHSGKSMSEPPTDESRGSYTHFTLQSSLFDRSLRNLGNAVGLPLSMFFILSLAIEILFRYILNLYGAIIGVEDLSLPNDPNILYIYSSCINIVTLTVPYLYTLKATKSTYSQLVSVKRVSRSKCLSLVMLGFGASTLSSYASTALDSCFSRLFGIEFQGTSPDYCQGPWSLVLMLLCVGILPAVLEEFAIRGVVLGALRKKFSDSSAIVLSALLFGLLHGNMQQIPFASLMGLLLGFATVYTGSIIPAVLIHAVNNISSVLLSFTLPTLSPLAQQITYITFHAVSLIIGICGFISIIKSDPNAFKLSADRSEETAKNTLSFFSSVGIIVFLAICVFQVLLAQGVISLG